MRYHEIVSAPPLLEGRGGYLYHAMNERKTLRVLATDTMEANWTHRLPTNPDADVKGISFTRDRKLQWANMQVRLTVDQRRLAQAHRIIPVDGHYVHQHTRQRLDWENVHSRTKAGLHANADDPAEEFVVGNIKALHRYVTEIAILRAAPELGNLVHVARAYSEKWNIPLRLAPEVTDDFDRWVAEGGTAHPQIVQYFPDYRPVEPPAPEKKPARRRRAKAA